MVTVEMPLLLVQYRFAQELWAAETAKEEPKSKEEHWRWEVRLGINMKQ